jgi:hypothetical protein
MAENESQGITRRDLLKRGAALGGAVVWATPVVQTLGMGRAFAQVPSPTGKDISYLVVNWDCPEGNVGYAKWENGWKPGSTPNCSGLLYPGSTEVIPPPGIFVNSVNGACASVTVSTDYSGCTVQVLLKAGSGEGACQSTTVTTFGSAVQYCTV